MGIKPWMPHLYQDSRETPGYCKTCNLPSANERHKLSTPVLTGPIIPLEPEPNAHRTIVVLQVTRPADSTLPSEWDWPALLDEPDVKVLASSTDWLRLQD